MHSLADLVPAHRLIAGAMQFEPCRLPLDMPTIMGRTAFIINHSNALANLDGRVVFPPEYVETPEYNHAVRLERLDQLHS